MNKLFLILLIALFSCKTRETSLAVSGKKMIASDTVRSTKIVNKENRFSIKTTPVSLINIIDDPSARLGLEVNIYRNLSLYAEGGSYFSYRKTGLNSGAQGFLLNPELRVYVNRNGESKGTYISLDYRYKDRSFNWVDTFYNKPGVIPRFYSKDFRIHTITNSFKLKMGQVGVAGPLLFEVFAGIGIKFRDTTSGLTAEEEVQVNREKYSTFYWYKSHRGHFIAPDMMIGVRIGFCFK